MNNDEYEQTQTRFRSVIRDRRRYPRVALDRRGQVLMADGGTVAVNVHDLSPDGIQLRCGRARAMRIHPDARSVRHDEPPRPISVALTLPLVPHPAPVRLDGHLLYFALINPNLAALGVEFDRLSATTRGFLDRFIRESLRPAESR